MRKYKIAMAMLMTATVFFYIGMRVGEARAPGRSDVPDPVINDAIYLQAPVTEAERYEQMGYEVFTATAYCGCCECNGEWSDGSTAQSATGEELIQGISVAADFDVLPPYTWIEVSGIGLFNVQDCGSAIKGNRIDIYFNDHEEAEAFGVQEVRVRVCE